MQLTDETMMTSSLPTSESVAASRNRSISSFVLASFSIYVSVCGMYASGW